MAHHEVQTDEDRRRHLQQLIKGFDTAMLVTRTEDGSLRARPLAIAEARDDGRLYFATAIDSPKVKELEADPRVNVSMQAARRYVSITGAAHVVRDKTLIEALWSPAWKTWFPGGKDDPSLCLVAIEPQDAEYWDDQGGKALRHLFSAARALATGTRPAVDDDQHAKVRL